MKNEDGLLQSTLENARCLSSGQLDPCLYHSWPPDASTRGVHLTEGQPDPQANQMCAELT